jgi:hypothetical protein
MHVFDRETLDSTNVICTCTIITPHSFFSFICADSTHHRVRALRLRRGEGGQQQHELRVPSRQLADESAGREALAWAGNPLVLLSSVV